MTGEAGSAATDRTHRLLRRRFVLPACAILVCAFSALGALVLVSANRQDAISAARTRDVVVAVVNQQSSDLKRLTKDYTVWDAAVDKLYDQLDASWADDNVGPYLYDQFDIDMSLVVAPDHRVTYFARGGARATPVPLAALSPLLAECVDAALSSDPVDPDPVVDFFRIGDDVFLIGFGAVTPETIEPGFDPRSRAVLVLARRFDQDLLSDLGMQFKIADLTLATETRDSVRESGGRVQALAIFNMQKDVVATLYWRPPAPGQSWLSVMLPGLAGLFVVVVTLAWRVFGVWRETLINLLAREHELREAHEVSETASRAKTTFLANMSHELRTPLNAIIGFSSIMTEQLMGPIGSKKYQGYARDIQGTARYLLSLIDEVLDLASFESDRIALNESCFPAGDALAEALRLARGEFGAVRFVEEHGQAEAMLIVADRTKIVQILTNLLSNAAKASGDDSMVHTMIDVTDGGGLRFAISDTGRGLSGARDPAELEQLTTPFGRGSGAPAFRTGYGIGLAVSRKLAQLHDADLTLENRETGGVLAALILPAARLRTDPLRVPSAS